MPNDDCSHSLFLLQGRIQHYHWGGYHFIPELLGRRNDGNRPFAELWMGAHAQAPSEALCDAGPIPLHELIQREPAKILGSENRQRYGDKLPYLFKILDVRDMLSIQVHPSRPQAAAGFAAEEAAGIAIHAPQRNYKDCNHKPEVQIALSEFWMLHGFRPLAEIADVLTSIPAFADLAPWFPLYLHDVEEESADGRELLRRFYEEIMNMPQAVVDRLLQSLLAPIIPLYEQGLLKKISPHYWAAKAARTFPLPGGGMDRGIFSIYFMNLIGLKPGQGTFQGAGLPHAYLEGINVELMANSDNVLRGGLTVKHVDVPELLKVLDFSSGRPGILEGQPLSETEQLYPTPTDDFQLSRIGLKAGQEHNSARKHGPDIMIVLEGSAQITAVGESYLLQRGTIVLAAADSAWRLRSAATGALVFRATAPIA